VPNRATERADKRASLRTPRRYRGPSEASRRIRLGAAEARGVSSARAQPAGNADDETRQHVPPGRVSDRGERARRGSCLVLINLSTCFTRHRFPSSVPTHLLKRLQNRMSLICLPLNPTVLFGWEDFAMAGYSHGRLLVSFLERIVRWNSSLSLTLFPSMHGRLFGLSSERYGH